MKKAAQCFLVLAILLFPKLILAGDSNVQVKIENNVNTHSSTSVNQNSNADIDISTSGGGDTSVEINNDDFKISGDITAVASGDFEIANQKILNEPSKFSDYSLSGSLEVGKKASASGKVIDGKLYAIKINVEGNSSSTPTPTPQINPSPSPNPSAITSELPSPSASPSASPQSSPTPQEIMNDLNEVIAVLEGIVKVLVTLF